MAFLHACVAGRDKSVMQGWQRHGACVCCAPAWHCSADDAAQLPGVFSTALDWQDGKGGQAYSLVMMTAYTITPINAPVGAVA